MSDRVVPKLVAMSAAVVLAGCGPTAPPPQPAPKLGTELSNKIFAERAVIDRMGQGRFDRLGEIYDSSFKAHTADGDSSLIEDNERVREWRRAVPDLAVSANNTIAEGAQVAVQWTARGTNAAAAADPPRNGSQTNVNGMSLFRFRGGRISDEWRVMEPATPNSAR